MKSLKQGGSEGIVPMNVFNVTLPPLKENSITLRFVIAALDVVVYIRGNSINLNLTNT